MMDFFSESDCSSVSNSSMEQDDDIETLFGGQASNILTSLEETIGKIDDFLSFESEFSYGDVVCPSTDPSGQLGRVVNVDMFVDLEDLQGQKIKDVSSAEIQKIRSISVGDYVVLGPWLGKVDKIIDCVTILYDDGTKSEFTTMGPEKLLPLRPNLLEDSQYPYYPGQRVRIELPNVSRSVRWLCGRGKEKRDEGTVFSVEAGLVYVDWLACAMLGCERGPAPACVQDSKDLTLLSFPSRANWQLGDWCIFPAADCRGDMERFYLDGSTCDLIDGLKQAEEIFLGRTSPNFGEIFVIVKVKTKVDVLWQDGTRSMGLDSHSLFPINAVDAHDFWPDQIVIDKGISDDPGFSSGQRWGFVRWFDAKERTAGVKWNIPEMNPAIELGGEEMEETVSAYELIEHPDYSYYLGDVVFRLEKNQLVDKIDGQIWVGEQTVFSSNCSLSCIGVVMGVKEGNVEVKWASGHTTNVAPYEIFRMDKYEALFPIPVPHEENVDPTTEHSIEHDKESLAEGKNLLDSGNASIPRAAVGIFASIMGSLFASLGSTSLSGRSHLNLEKGDGWVCNCEGEAVLESSNLCNEGLLTLGNRNLEQEVEESLEAFNQFDMVTGCLDHHFVKGAGEGLALPQVKRGWLKKIQEEWSILEKDLPETIYVRVYEDRMDLLRAAIIGAPGTPYQDGLFFFDIFLPPDYPHVPPLVHYNSGGLRLNPNLYESGKVCLSLLNTWTGTGTEVWNPGSSTILQVLLSLQALVLNEKPYYNEAGYDNQMGRAEGEKNSVSYNESAFIGNCKSMLYLLRKPPKHFEEFVHEHFSRRSNNILLACKAYMEGTSVGCDFGYTKSEQENQRGSSTGFKIMLSKLFPKLVEAFSGMGIDCSQYVDPGI